MATLTFNTDICGLACGLWTEIYNPVSLLLYVFYCITFPFVFPPFDCFTAFVLLSYSNAEQNLSKNLLMISHESTRPACGLQFFFTNTERKIPINFFHFSRLNRDVSFKDHFYLTNLVFFGCNFSFCLSTQIETSWQLVPGRFN